ncbi:MAG: moeA [Sporomusa sp.]|jgi:molybdopterin molybdotransferase|nr:moeA [Sporomusa sp.]
MLAERYALEHVELKLEAAREVLLQVVDVMPKERIPLESCWRRVLAETVVADIDYPPFDRSPLDGYAVIATDVSNATLHRPVKLQQVGNIPAGTVSDRQITTGTACRIMTGAPIPAGATGVVRLEDTKAEGDTVYIFDGRGVDKNFCFRGEEMMVEEQVIEAGTVINFGAMGMLALLGKAYPQVFLKPRVSIIATGSEIIPVHEQLVPGKIRNSNSYMLNAQVQEAGAQTVMMSSAKDDIEEIARLIANVPECDLVITTGGASVGDYDLIGAVYKKLGIKLLFSRVSMKPGMPVLAGIKNGKLYIGLSGNPAAAAISFEQLVRAVLMKMSGRRMWWRPRVRVTLTQPFNKRTVSPRFVWARCWQENQDMFAEPLKHSSNGMLKAAITANSLLVIPENSPPLSAGTEVEAVLLTEFNYG